jgi:hypothetical protein
MLNPTEYTILSQKSKSFILKNSNINLPGINVRNRNPVICLITGISKRIEILNVSNRIRNKR